MKNNRASHQTARKGWKPRKTSDARLAKDIAKSIKAHNDAGVIRSASDYTQRSEIIHMVESILTR
jgi:hypothetical protein